MIFIKYFFFNIFFLNLISEPILEKQIGKNRKYYAYMDYLEADNPQSMIL